MIESRRINEIQHPIMNPHVLREGIAAEVHDGGGGAGLQVDALQGIDAVVDEKSVELFPCIVHQHLLLPATVGLHLAVPFAVFVEGERVTLQLVASGIENNGFVVDVGENIELVVDGINRGIDGLDECDLIASLPPPNAGDGIVILDVVEQFWFLVATEYVLVITQSCTEKMALPCDESAVSNGYNGGKLVKKGFSRHGMVEVHQ